MSKVKIQGNASGTGVVTLTAPNTNTDRTITLPDGDITLGGGVDGIVSTATSTAITIDANENVVIGQQEGTSSSANQRLLINADAQGGIGHGLYIHNDSYTAGSARISLGPRYSFSYNTSPYIEALSESTSAASLVFGTTTGTTGTERMRIDSAGVVTMPNQPAFDVAASSAGGTNLTGIISHPTTYIDRGNDHNGTRFTAPVTGVYHFYTAHIKNTQSATVGRRRFLINGAPALNGRHQRLDETSTGYNGGGTFSVLISLTVGDYVEVDQYAGSSHGSWEYDYFGGHLVG